MRMLRRRKYTFAAAVCFGIVFGFLLVRLQNPFCAAVEEHSFYAANKAVEYALECINCSDLVKISSGNTGNVKAVVADGMKISRLKSEIALKIDDYIKHSDADFIKVPLLSFGDNLILSSIGPSAKLKIKPTSLVSLDFRDSFSSAGINQTRHTIYLDTYITVNITSAFRKKTEKIHNSVLVADTVIVGDVPEYYGLSAATSITGKGKK